MKLSRNSQQKNDLQSHISSIILKIKELTGWNQTQIAEKLGLTHRTVWAAEHKKGGSTQLLRGLEMLLELQTRKSIRWPDAESRRRAEARADAAGLELEVFAALCVDLFGAKLADAIMIARKQRSELNDAADPAPVSSSTTAAAAERLFLEAAHRVLDTLDNKKT